MPSEEREMKRTESSGGKNAAQSIGAKESKTNVRQGKQIGGTGGGGGNNTESKS